MYRGNSPTNMKISLSLEERGGWRWGGCCIRLAYRLYMDLLHGCCFCPALVFSFLVIQISIVSFLLEAESHVAQATLNTLTDLAVLILLPLFPQCRSTGLQCLLYAWFLQGWGWSPSICDCQESTLPAKFHPQHSLVKQFCYVVQASLELTM